MTALLPGRPPQPWVLDWTPDLITRHWDGLAHTRAFDLGFSRLAGRHLLTLIAPELDRLKAGGTGDGGRILDFGAGKGDLLALLVEAGHRAAGYEPSAGLRADAPRSLLDHPLFQGFLPDAAEAEEHGNGSGPLFDLILLVEVVEHLPAGALPALLARAGRWLAPGGRLVVTTPNAEDLGLQTVFCPSCDALFHRWQHLHSLGAATLRRMMEEAGFATLALHEAELTDRIFLEDGRPGAPPRAAADPAFAALFRSGLDLHLGDATSLVWVGMRRDEAPPAAGRFGHLKPRALVRATTVLDIEPEHLDGLAVLADAAALPPGRPVHIFGTGRGGDLLLAELTAAGVPVVGFIDVAAAGDGATHAGLPVLGVDRFIAGMATDSPVVLSNRHVAANGRRLLDAGFHAVYNGHPLVMRLAAD